MLPAEAAPQHSRCCTTPFPYPLGYEFLIPYTNPTAVCDGTRIEDGFTASPAITSTYSRAVHAALRSQSELRLLFDDVENLLKLFHLVVLGEDHLLARLGHLRLLVGRHACAEEGRRTECRGGVCRLAQQKCVDTERCVCGVRPPPILTMAS